MLLERVSLKSFSTHSLCLLSFLARLTTNVELLTLALDVLVEAEQLVSSTGAGVVLLVVAVLPVELVCVSMDANGMSSSYVWLHMGR